MSEAKRPLQKLGWSDRESGCVCDVQPGRRHEPSAHNQYLLHSERAIHRAVARSRSGNGTFRKLERTGLSENFRKPHAVSVMAKRILLWQNELDVRVAACRLDADCS